MDVKREAQLFEEIFTRMRELGLPSTYAPCVKNALQKELESYCKVEIQKSVHTPKQTARQLQRIKCKAIAFGILGIFGIFPLILIFYSLYQSFETCDGLFGDSFEGYLRWHKHFNKFDIKYDKFYSPNNEVDFYKYPWIARIISLSNRSKTYACAGFLINDRDILATAHCFYDRDSVKFEIYLGGKVANQFTDSIIVPSSKFKTKLHPEFRPSKFQNDIALVKLDEIIHFSDTVYPLKLPFERPQIPESLTLTYWNADPNYTHHLVLKEVLIPIREISYCSKFYNSIHFDKVALVGTFYKTTVSTQFCGGDDDTYFAGGNSGMPILSKDENVPIAYGIFSLGPTMGNKKPQVFTRVYPFLHWILCNAGENFCDVKKP